MNELIDALRNHRVCDEDKCSTCEPMNDAADALEAQQSALDECATQLADMAKRIEDLETALVACRVRRGEHDE